MGRVASRRRGGAPFSWVWLAFAALVLLKPAWAWGVVVAGADWWDTVAAPAILRVIVGG